MNALTITRLTSRRASESSSGSSLCRRLCGVFVVTIFLDGWLARQAISSSGDQANISNDCGFDTSSDNHSVLLPGSQQICRAPWNLLANFHPVTCQSLRRIAHTQASRNHRKLSIPLRTRWSNRCDSASSLAWKTIHSRTMVAESTPCLQVLQQNQHILTAETSASETNQSLREMREDTPSNALNIFDASIAHMYLDRSYRPELGFGICMVDSSTSKFVDGAADAHLETNALGRYMRCNRSRRVSASKWSSLRSAALMWLRTI